MSFFSVLDKATLENLASDPTSVSGRMYLNTTTGAKWYDGAAWRVAATLDSTQTFTNKTLTAAIISDFEELTHAATPATPLAGFVRIYAKSDSKIYKKTSAGIESEVGGASGLLKFDQVYLSNPIFPLAHGLIGVPTLHIAYQDGAGDWHWSTGEGTVKVTATDIKGSLQTYFDLAATSVRVVAIQL